MVFEFPMQPLSFDIAILLKVLNFPHGYLIVTLQCAGVALYNIGVEFDF